MPTLRRSHEEASQVPVLRRRVGLVRAMPVEPDRHVAVVAEHSVAGWPSLATEHVHHTGRAGSYSPSVGVTPSVLVVEGQELNVRLTTALTSGRVASVGDQHLHADLPVVVSMTLSDFRVGGPPVLEVFPRARATPRRKAAPITVLRGKLVGGLPRVTFRTHSSVYRSQRVVIGEPRFVRLRSDRQDGAPEGLRQRFCALRRVPFGQHLLLFSRPRLSHSNEVI